MHPADKAMNESTIEDAEAGDKEEPSSEWKQ